MGNKYPIRQKLNKKKKLLEEFDIALKNEWEALHEGYEMAGDATVEEEEQRISLKIHDLRAKRKSIQEKINSCEKRLSYFGCKPRSRYSPSSYMP